MPNKNVEQMQISIGVRNQAKNMAAVQVRYPPTPVPQQDVDITSAGADCGGFIVSTVADAVIAIQSRPGVEVVKTLAVHDRNVRVVEDGVLLPGETAYVLPMYTTTPCDLFRTVAPNEVLPMVSASIPHALSAMVPQHCGMFNLSKRELNLQNPDEWWDANSDGLVVHGLSLFCSHPTVLRHQEDHRAPVVAGEPSSCCEVAESWPPETQYADTGSYGVLLRNYEADDGVLQTTVRRRRRGFFCFMLPKGTDLAPFGLAVVHDNICPGHFSIVPHSNDDVVWQEVDLVKIASNDGLSIFCFSPGNGLFVKGFSARFQLHCFTMKANGLPETDLFAPGADPDAYAAASIIYEHINVHMDGWRDMVDVVRILAENNFVLSRLSARIRASFRELITRIFPDSTDEERVYLDAAEDALITADHVNSFIIYGTDVTRTVPGPSDEQFSTIDMQKLAWLLSLSELEIDSVLNIISLMSRRGMFRHDLLSQFVDFIRDRKFSGRPVADSIIVHTRVEALEVASVVVRLRAINPIEVDMVKTELDKRRVQKALLLAACVTIGRVVGIVPKVVVPAIDELLSTSDRLYLELFTASKSVQRNRVCNLRVGSATRRAERVLWFMERGSSTCVRNTLVHGIELELWRCVGRSDPDKVASTCAHMPEAHYTLKGGLVMKSRGTALFLLATRSAGVAVFGPEVIGKLLADVGIHIKRGSKRQILD